jgi:hypothetical protein
MAIKWKVIFEKSRKSMYAKGSFTLTYNKGTIVKAIKGTLGIMVFKNRWQAEMFAETHSNGCLLSDPFIVIRVRTFSRGVVPKEISRRIDAHDIALFYKHLYRSFPGSPPMGTICYDKVEVID